MPLSTLQFSAGGGQGGGTADGNFTVTTNDDEEEQNSSSGGGDGGGLFGSITGAAGDAYDTVAGAADHAAGSTDEAVGRQFDSQAGGGIPDGLKSFTGITSFRESEQGQNLASEYQNVEGGLMDLGGHAKRFDIATQAGMDFLLDNPNASAQDTIRGGLEAATGSENLGEQAQDAATGFSSFTSGLISGTPLDNPATDAAVWAGDALVADPAKAGLTAATGIDVDEGTTEGTVGAAEAFDVGVTVGTAGLGSAALKGSDEAASGLASYLARSSDEAAQASDDAGRALTDGGQRVGDHAIDGSLRPVDDASDTFNVAEEAPEDPVISLSQGTDGVWSFTDEAAQAGDETAQGAATVTDEAGQVTDDMVDGSLQVADDLPAPSTGTGGRLAEYVASAADDAAMVTDEAGQVTDDMVDGSLRVADEFATGADDAAAAADETASVADDVAAGTDEAAQATDDATSSSSSFRDYLGTGADDAAQAASRAADETAQAASRAGDEAGTLAGRVRDRLAGVTDDLLGGSDEAAEVAARSSDDAGGLFTKRNLALGTGAFLAGGVASTVLDGAGDPRQAPDDITTANGRSLSGVKSYQPTEKFPNGGKLYAVTENFQNIGYWTLLGVQGRTLYVLDSSGEPRKAKISAEQFSEMMAAREQQRQQQNSGNSGGSA